MNPRRTIFAAAALAVVACTDTPTATEPVDVLAFASATLTLEDEASCEALDAKGGNPADPDELLGTWDQSSMTCTIEPVSFGLTIVRVGSEDVLVIAAGVTLFVNGSIRGERVIVDGDLVNNGTIVSGVSVSGVATNNGSIVGSVGVDGLVTNNGVINLLTGGPVDPDWLSVSADGELVNRGEILAGQVRNRGLVTNHGDVIIGGDAGSIGASGLWLDRQDAVTVNHGLFDNHGAAAGLQISHFIVEGARFTNYGEYIHGPTAGGGAMEIFSDGIFENIGSYTNLGPILFINYEFSPIDGIFGLTPGGGGDFIIKCGSTFVYPLEKFIADSPTWECDDTPPVITVDVDGDLGDKDWYTSDITISWTVTDDESDITIVDGCTDETVTSDTSGNLFNCRAESDGGEAAAEVTVKRDATDPTVTYSGNIGQYDVSDEVAITCSSDDTTSGVASDTCADVSGAAYTFGLGTSSFSATATDNAGNIGEGSTSFEVTASFDGLCALVETFVSHAGTANSMCVKIAAAERADARGRTNARDNSLSAFINEVEAQTGKRVDADDAAVLIEIATALMS